MENIIIYPKNDEQKSFLKTLLHELKVKFEIGEGLNATLSQSDYLRLMNR